MSRSAPELLTEARAHLELALTYANSASSGQMVVDAMSLRLSAAIESLSRLDEPVRMRIFGNDWPLMWGMRNRIAHGYMLVNRAIIHETLALDVPQIIAAIDKALEETPFE